MVISITAKSFKVHGSVLHIICALAIIRMRNYHPTAAVFSFTQTSYDVDEGAGNAAVAVELSGADLTFPVPVTVETVLGGSASGMYGRVSCITCIDFMLTMSKE